MNFPTQAIRAWIDGDASRMLLISTQSDAALSELGELRAVAYIAKELSARYRMPSKDRSITLYSSLLDWSISQVDWDELARLYVERAYKRARYRI